MHARTFRYTQPASKTQPRHAPAFAGTQIMIYLNNCLQPVVLFRKQHKRAVLRTRYNGQRCCNASASAQYTAHHHGYRIYLSVDITSNCLGRLLPTCLALPLPSARHTRPTCALGPKPRSASPWEQDCPRGPYQNAAWPSVTM